MTSELISTENEVQKTEVKFQGGSSEAIYGIGLFGAWAFYISRATTNRERVLGFFKGFAWPAFLVYELLQFLHKD